MNPQIKIPKELLASILELLDNMDVTEYPPSILQLYDSVYFALKAKEACIALREAYAKIVFAKDEETQFEARINYLAKKNHCQEPF